MIDNAQAAFLKSRPSEPQQWLTEPDPSAKETECPKLRLELGSPMLFATMPMPFDGFANVGGGQGGKDQGLDGTGKQP